MKTRLHSMIKYLVLVLMLGVGYFPTFSWMWRRWNAEDTYYSHGPFVVLASLFFVWILKDKLKVIKKTPDDQGIRYIVAGFVLHVAGIWTELYFLSALSLILIIMGMILYLWGRAFFKKLFFATIYLIFMIPLPLVLVSNAVIRMKMFAAQAATKTLNIIGLAAVRDGSIIKMANSYLQVEAPCSGLRSLIALMAFGAAFSYLTRKSLLKKYVLFMSALPIALIANILRIVLLGWVSEVYGMKAAAGWIHDFSGFLLFFVAAIGMLIVNALLSDQQKGIAES